ncbi:MAG: hypothetical protein AB7E79_05995 [Rhodospirillaceae bacterium]
MASAPKYEAGMSYTYDECSGKVSVTFRGRIAVLAGTFATKEYARVAAEGYCRKRGWKDGEETKVHSLLAYRRAV